ncbi:MAG: bifunctional phosphopantothenoylcysteine decarboxylase/phosphopantothenate--cysteine ligase CoaBC [Gaiellales bacterium]
MARVLLGVTGGIAAYKACELIRLLVKAGHEVMPLPTAAATRFVSPETLYALARTTPAADPYPHLAEADLLVIAPLTANTMARLAHGHADDLLTEAVLAHPGPVLVAPAMNTHMWHHPATQANLEILRSRGVHIVGPDDGELAEGMVGIGRMSEPEEIARVVAGLLDGAEPERPAMLSGRRVVVSAGGTREPLDDVRFLGNRSSGRMGIAVAEAARDRGAEVVLLAANLLVPPPPGVDVVEASTAAELRREALARIDADVFVMAAAVADYRPAERIDGKRPKDGEPWLVELVPTADIARALGSQKAPGHVLVTFGAELGEEGLERKRRMLDDKNADLVVYNDVGVAGTGFDALDNEVVLVTRAGDRRLPRAPKREIAEAIVDEIERLLGAFR